MTQTAEEVTALFRRWRRSTVWALVILTATIFLAFIVFGGPKEKPNPSAIPVWISLPAIYAIFGLYSLFNWRAVKRDFLAGKSADDALRARL